MADKQSYGNAGPPWWGELGELGDALYPSAGVAGGTLGWTLGEDSIWRKGDPSPRNTIQMVAEPGSPGEGQWGGWVGKGPGPLGLPGTFPDSNPI